MAIINGDDGNNGIEGTTGDDIIHGGAGDDSINGKGGNDKLYGDDGNDVIIGGADNNSQTLYIDGGAGNDHITANVTQTATILGGDGNDYIDFTGPRGQISGGAGDDGFYITTSSPGGTIGVHGDTGADSFTITPGNGGTVIAYGDGGNDTMTDSANGGTSTLYGGNGNDTLIASNASGTVTLDGGTGNDTIEIGASTVTSVVGGTGTDTLVLGPGIPFADNNHITFAMSSWSATASGFEQLTLNYTPGSGGVVINEDDTANTLDFSGLTFVPLAANENVLVIFGNGGDDVLIAPDGVNTYLYGGAGNDQLTGGTGNDQLNGDDGNDTLNGGAGGDTLSGGAGTNILNGGDGNDTVWGTGNDTIDGGTGNDFISWYAPGSVASIAGGDGNDTISAAGTLTSVDGGNGNDIIQLAGAVSTLTGGAGTDTLTLDGSLTLAMASFSAASSGIEKIGDGRQYYAFNGDDNANTFDFSGFKLTAANPGPTAGVPTYGNDIVPANGVIVNGMGGNDIITGTAANDTINGGDGNDTLKPGSGNDTAIGGDGNDLIVFGANLTAADSIDGGPGTDSVSLSGDYATTPLVFSATTMINVEKLTLGTGHSYNLTTSNANVAAGQTLTVDASALAASDALTFNGSAETDGSFTFISGLGADDLTGGAGADTFVYKSATRSTSTHYDTLHNVDFGKDVFDTPGGVGTIKGIDTAVTSGSLSTATFDTDLASDVASLGAHHAMLFTANAGTLSGQTFLVVDLNGTAGYQAGQDLVIRLASHTGTLAVGGFV